MLTFIRIVHIRGRRPPQESTLDYCKRLKKCLPLIVTHALAYVCCVSLPGRCLVSVSCLCLSFPHDLLFCCSIIPWESKHCHQTAMQKSQKDNATMQKCRMGGDLFILYRGYLSFAVDAFICHQHSRLLWNMEYGLNPG